jgi:branched-chain amino acid transport system substrate-binding protein
MRKILVVLMITMVGLSCSKKEETTQIGVILPLTGELASFGKTVLNGVQLAVDDYNNEENNSPKVSLVIEDSKATPNVAVNAFNKLIDVDHVKIVIGDLTSGATLAMAPIAQKNKIILISPTASNPALSHSGEYFFRVWPSDNYSGFVAANYSYKELEKRKAAIIYINNDYGYGLKEVFDSTFTTMGGSVLISEAYSQDRTDFKNILVKIKNMGADLIYVPGHPYGIAYVAKQSIEIGLKVALMSDVAAEDKEFIPLAGNAAKGLYFVTPAFNINSTDSSVANFVSRYKEKYSEVPDVHAVKGYESMEIILSAVKQNHQSVDAIKVFLKGGKFHVVGEKLDFDKNGDVKSDMTIKQYQNNLEIRSIKVFSGIE